MSSIILWIGHNNDHHYYISNHCAIEDDDELVLTGGVGSAKMATVTRYNMEGEATSLPYLITGRNYHACGKFTSADLETVSLVS